jgi:hypothetical protein
VSTNDGTGDVILVAADELVRLAEGGAVRWRTPAIGSPNMMEVRDGVALVENGHGISCAGIDSASGRTLWRAEGALLANEDALLVRGEASTRLLDRRTGSELRTLDPSVLWVGHGYRLERTGSFERRMSRVTP